MAADYMTTQKETFDIVGESCPRCGEQLSEGHKCPEWLRNGVYCAADEPKQLEPIRAKKERKSSKAPAIKAQVVLKRANGEHWTKISKDLHIAKNTAKAIVEEANIDNLLEDHRAKAIELIPLAHNAVKTRLLRGDGNLGRQVMVDMGIIGERAQGNKGIQVQATLHQQILLATGTTIPSGENEAKPAIELSTVESKQIG